MTARPTVRGHSAVHGAGTQQLKNIRCCPKVCCTVLPSYSTFAPASGTAPCSRSSCKTGQQALTSSHSVLTAHSQASKRTLHCSVFLNTQAKNNTLSPFCTGMQAVRRREWSAPLPVMCSRPASSQPHQCQVVWVCSSLQQQLGAGQSMALERSRTKRSAAILHVQASTLATFSAACQGLSQLGSP